MAQFTIPIDQFLAEMQAGKVTINVIQDKDANGKYIEDASGNRIDHSTWTRQNFDAFGNRLPDIVEPVPPRAEIKQHIADLQETLSRTQDDITRLNAEIANVQLVDKMYDELKPQ
jgi:hypothetical protein